jgi:hypothetical protein
MTDFEFQEPVADSETHEVPTEENTSPDHNLADDTTPAASTDEGEKSEVLPDEGHTQDLSGIQDNPEPEAASENPEDTSKTAVEPAALETPEASEENSASDEKSDSEDHITSSGNKVYEEKEALSNVGMIHQANTTAAYIEIVHPRQPGLEAFLRASATDSGLADGSIKREDAPGFKVPEGGINPESGGKPEDGNSITGATKPSEDPAVNPNSPIQVGDTKETAQAASETKSEKS